MALRFDKNELWLFVQLDAKREHVYDEDAELLVQLIDIEARQVVLFALLGAGGTIVRAALDGLAAETRAVLERVERVFRAQVAIYVGGEQRGHAHDPGAARTKRTRHPRAPGAAAAQRIEAPSRRGDQRALKRPPPVRDEQLPFGPPQPQAASTSSVLSALERLTSNGRSPTSSSRRCSCTASPST